MRKPNKELGKEAQALYDTGMSTRRVALELGWSPSYIARLLVCRDRALGVRMAMNKDKRPSTHWRSTRARARATWEQCVGPIPEGYHIHHTDNDPTNNCFSNLECMSREDHWLRHPANPIPVWLREHKKLYMRQYMKQWRQKNKDRIKIYRQMLKE
jgi:hypothetical protein